MVFSMSVSVSVGEFGAKWIGGGALSRYAYVRTT